MELAAALLGAAARRYATLTAIVLWMSLGAGCARVAATQALAIPVAPAVFPLRFAPGTRYPVDARGTPFLIQGDSAWSLEVGLTPAELAQYLDDRQARGFNTLEFELIEHKYATRPPYNRAGQAPFTGRIANAHGSQCVNATIPDCWSFATPDEAYWAHVDAVLEAATARGFLLLVYPAYLGYRGGDQGWYQDMLANGPEVLAAYGRFVAARYRGYRNLIWVEGGDYIPPRRELVEAVAGGIRSAWPEALQTAHTESGHAAREIWGGEPWLSLDALYTGYSVYSQARAEYAASTLPFLLLEAPYEDLVHVRPGGGDADEQQLRAEAWEALLGGACGALMGNDPIWPFRAGWQSALNSRGAQSMTHLHNLLSARAWWTLRPDPPLIVGGQGSGARFAPAALATDRTWALVYHPQPGELAVDFGRLDGPRVQARWYDPSDGAFVPVTGSPFPNAGVRTLRPPARNASGFSDWLLVLESGTPGGHDAGG